MAFKELIAKITISEDKKNLNSTNLKLIKSLVDSFTIVDDNPSDFLKVSNPSDNLGKFKMLTYKEFTDTILNHTS